MKRRAFPYVMTALAVLGGGVAWLECGGGSTCGNGKVEDGEQCDKGPLNGVDGSGCSATCQFANIAVASIQVSYSKLQNEVPGFNGVACGDLGINGAHVVLSGPSGADEMWMGCMQSKMYTNVTPGTYQASITLLDATGAALTKSVMTAMTDVQKGPVTNLAINFKQADFVKQDYMGNLQFNPNWGAMGKSCSDAGVTMESVTLKKMDGTLVTMPTMTSDGLTINGAAGTCFVKDPAKTILNEHIGPLPWGHYTLGLVGKGTGGMDFCKTFDVFAPPGLAPMTFELVVDPFSASADGGSCP
jgi:cysteine-rich repeat protein